jgi:zinc transport system substrate-binding protein
MAGRMVAGWLLAALLAGATATAVRADAGKDDLKVVATIKPIHSLLTQLMEGVGKPTLLVEGSASPHAFALKPSGVRAIDAADVFVRVSDNLEPFTRKLVRALPEGVRLVTLAEAPGVKLLPLRRSGAFEAHVHPGREHEAGTEEVHGDDAASGMDGHIWLDPDNAKAIVAYLAQVLAERAPAAADRLAANARRLNARIDALTADIAAEVDPLKGKPFVVFHDAYQYFEKRFGLNAVGAITLSPDVQPSARRLTELRRKIKSLDAVCVFAEPQFQPNLVAAVTEGTTARSGALDPEGSTLTPGPELYFELMRKLAGGLKACLGASS